MKDIHIRLNFWSLVPPLAPTWNLGWESGGYICEWDKKIVIFSYFLFILVYFLILIENLGITVLLTVKWRETAYYGPAYPKLEQLGNGLLQRKWVGNLSTIFTQIKGR